MNPAQSRVITRGRDAGLPRPITDIVIDAGAAAREIAMRLKRNGFTVIDYGAGCGRPYVQVSACRLTQELVAADAACYYKHSTVHGVPERHGQFNAQTDDGRLVRVVWVERGH